MPSQESPYIIKSKCGFYYPKAIIKSKCGFYYPKAIIKSKCGFYYPRAIIKYECWRGFVMKKHLNISKIVCVILAFGCLWTAGCGGKTGEEAAGNDKGSGGQSASIGQPAVPGQTGNGGSSAPAMDLQSEREELFQKETNNLLGLQYDQGEIIRFRR
ncbi:MAG: hypothetical protein NC432_12870, partial [Roseburia sp.]|nr:hypothetical protein [Roseburia sp.]